MAHRISKDEEALTEVNVIPLADVSLVLLIILMVLSPMITQALFHVSAANAQKALSQEELATPETPIIVSFEPGALKLNGTPMGSDMEFVKRLESAIAGHRDKSVLLTAAPDVLHGKVVHIMDMIRRHGATNLVMLKWAGGDAVMIAAYSGRAPFEVRMPNMRNAFGFALSLHVGMFIWNPTLFDSSVLHKTQVMMQVEFRDKLPEIPKPPEIVKKIEKKEVVHKAKKSGISLAKHTAPVPIRPVKKMPPKVVSNPLPRSRPSMVKMPKFIPHASDEEIVATNRPAKLATTTALRPASSPFTPAPKLVAKSRGIRASDVHFELTERGGISSAAAGRVVNIPIGEESGSVAVVASAPQLHDAPLGKNRTRGFHYQAPLGEGVGELSGKNRAGYVGAIQVGEPSEEEVIAAGNTHGSAVGKGVEIGGPVGDRKILRRHLPEYPPWAEEKGISAIVKIFFTVKSDGTIRRTLRVVHSSGYSELDSLAKEALLAWKFSPTRTASSAEEAWGVVTFRFTLA